MKKKIWKENILYSVLHRDELTPHLHISFVPIVDKNFVLMSILTVLRKFRDFVKKFMKSTKNMGLKKTTQKKAKAKVIAKHYQEVREYEALDKNINQEFKQLEELPKISFDTKKIDPRKNTNLSQFNEICKRFKG